METLLRGVDPHSITNLTLLCLFGIPIVIVDLKKQLIPFFLSIPAVLTALIVQLFFDVPLLVPAAGFFLGFISFYIIRIITKKGLGLGDAWVSGFIAVLMGIAGWMFSILAASLSALVFSLLVLKLDIRDRKHRIPFAPFLLGGSFVTMVLLLFYT